MWRGRFPITSFVLLVLSKKAASGITSLSREERLLFTSCEFWAATAARDLATYLGSEAGERLRDAHEAFSALGAARTARALKLANRGVRDPAHVPWGQEQVSNLEDRLLSSEDAIDQLIAQYALKLI